MSYQSRNIIVGAAAVFFSADDSLSPDWNTVTLPATVDGTPYASTLQNDADWYHPGYTTEGVELTYSPDYGEVEVDQLLDAAKLFKQKMTVTVNTSLAEATLENLMISWAQSGASLRGPGRGTLTDISGVEIDAANDFDGNVVPANELVGGLEAGALGVEPVERQMVFVGGSPRTLVGNKKRERIYHLRRALSVEASTHSLKRNEPTLFPVSFRLLPGTVSGAEYGTIRDRVITA